MAFPKMTSLAEASWVDPNITVKDKKINWNSLVYRLATVTLNFWDISIELLTQIVMKRKSNVIV
ncbi:hypothetical protein LZV37_01925 [Francisella tularensis]|nr:hypothetical protein [Francisella tularensis]